MILSKILGKSKEKIAADKKIDVLPKHVAVIMDGNGRWAKKRGMPRIFGHRAGAKNLKKVTRVFQDYGVKYLTVYAFSTENWSRPKNEVDGLMKLLLDYLRNAEKELGSDNIRVSVIGDRTKLSNELQQEVLRVEKLTYSNTGIDLVIALNYGSRDEIVHSVNEILNDIKNNKVAIDKVTEEDISKKLYTQNIPDPDLLIRTSGERRISNYLLWQLAYSELWFTDVYWPDFGKNEIDEALLEFSNRNRRFGGV